MKSKIDTYFDSNVIIKFFGNILLLIISDYHQYYQCYSSNCGNLKELSCNMQ